MKFLVNLASWYLRRHNRKSSRPVGFDTVEDARAIGHDNTTRKITLHKAENGYLVELVSFNPLSHDHVITRRVVKQDEVLIDAIGAALVSDTLK